MSPNQFLLAMFVLTPMCLAHIGGQQLSLQDLTPRVYCGRALAVMIDALCSEVRGVDKRSESGTMYGAPLITPFYKEQENHIGWPWLPSSKARALGSNRGKRFIGGVADECCDKACSINELLYYC